MFARKPKTAAGKRALKKKEAVQDEGAKSAIFLKSTSSSQVVNDVLKDLCALKKPDAKMFSKKNDIRPFEDHKPLEFLSQKNDNALFCLGSHSKKRPHNLVFARMFDCQMLDMIELGVQNVKKMDEFKASQVPKASLGNRPLIVFRGEHWESNDELRTIKSIFLDMFTGDQTADKIDLNNGISHAMVFTLVGNPSAPCRILLNVYTTELKKSQDGDSQLPRVELTEAGPFIEFVQRRTLLANMDMMRESLRVPKLNVVISAALTL
ncbi:hypothetical protein HDU91_001824 [Kappamyces sp. JEL0680]|nr:hypothetical protein HDU91_001824 [Kappamyces sp. JEL0680]